MHFQITNFGKIVLKFIHSATSDRVYIVSQNIDKGHMGCSCPGWRRYRTCKHLSALGLPGHETPVTLNLNFR